MSHEQFIQECRFIISKYNNGKGVLMSQIDTFIISSTWTLGNMKTIMGDHITDNMYELTYNKNTKEIYFNVYSKKDTMTFAD